MMHLIGLMLCQVDIIGIIKLGDVVDGDRTWFLAMVPLSAFVTTTFA